MKPVLDIHFFQFFCLYSSLEKLIKRAEIRQVKKTKKPDRIFWDTVDTVVVKSGKIQLLETEAILSILMKRFK